MGVVPRLHCAPLMAEGSLALVTGCPGWLGNRLLHYLRTPHPDWPDDLAQPQYERIRCLVLPDAPVERLRELVPADTPQPPPRRRLLAYPAIAPKSLDRRYLV